MTEKIAWLEEVLRLEPNSKLFFPLAQAYARDQRPNDAVVVLRKGLTFHPEHLEARLLLIECISELDAASRDAPSSAEAKPEIETFSSPELESLTGALARHPAFWRHWAASSRAQGQIDLAVTLDMLAVQLDGTRITWGTLLEQGLRAMTGGREQHLSPASQEIIDSKPLEPKSLAEAKPDSESAPEPDTTPDTEQEPEPESETKPPFDAESETALTLPTEPEAIEAQSLETEDEDDSLISEGQRRYYETKTYADLLAKQGEHQEALDLYAKLLQTSPDDEQRLDLETRIQELRDRGAREPMHEPDDSKEMEPLPEPKSESKPSIGKQDAPEDMEDFPASPPSAPSSKTATTRKTLTKLAERLESRAGK